MPRPRIRTALIGVIFLSLLAPATAADKPVKVFILAGQSNLEGQGFIKADPKRSEGKGSLERLTKDPATAEKFKAFVGTKDFWREKDVSPSGQGYHWNTNAETYYLIGEAMGHAMKKLNLPAK